MIHKMYVHTWFLLFAGVWVVVACTPTPEAVVTVVADRPTDIATPSLNTSDTPLPSNSPTTTPLLISQSPTAIPTPISTQDVAATYTAIHATSEAEAATLFAPTPTFTPSPTFTPIPGPTWRIFFRGAACQDNFACEDIIFSHEESKSYLIYSDGSQFIPITDLGFPADLSHPVFSPDGTQLAYLTRLDEESWHLLLANADGSGAVDLGTGDFFDFQFMVEESCLIVARFISWATDGINLAIETRCLGQIEPQWLENITLPAGQEIQFLPQTNFMLAYGEDVLTEEIKLFVHSINTDIDLIFTETKEHFIGTARWWPDGTQIEFITGLFTPGKPLTTTFNLIQSDGNNFQIRQNITAEFAITNGIWSPDGQEFAFTWANSMPAEESGLYVLDLVTGEWRQILSHFYLGSSPQLDIWPLSSD